MPFKFLGPHWEICGFEHVGSQIGLSDQSPYLTYYQELLLNSQSMQEVLKSFQQRHMKLSKPPLSFLNINPNQKIRKIDEQFTYQPKIV